MAQEGGRALPLALALPLMGTEKHRNDVLVPRLASGGQLGPDDPVFRRTSSEVIEVWGDVEIPIPYVVMADDPPRPVLRTYLWKAKAGNALYEWLRDATEAEQLCIGTRFEFFLPYGFVIEGSQVKVRVLKHYDDLELLWRQIEEHILRGYLGKKLDLHGRKILVPGRIETMRLTLDTVMAARRSLQHNTGIEDPTRTKEARQMIEAADASIRSLRTLPVITARDALEAAMATNLDEQALNRVFRAEGALKAEELRCAVIVMHILMKAEKLSRMFTKIQSGVDAGYLKVAEIASEVWELLQVLMRCSNGDCSVYPKKAKKLLWEARGVWAYLIKVCPLNPWHKVIVSGRGRGITKAIQHLENVFRATSPSSAWLIIELRSAFVGLCETLGAMHKLVEGTGKQKGQITEAKAWARTVTKKIAV